ncbi:MAG: TSUP family transporter [Sphingomonadales bacterium]|nr:TSUP family transporter [Sphingomonadales bacterium]MDE2169348.1 TSUP family transporter [Sphingomonadales bacterium]
MDWTLPALTLTGVVAGFVDSVAGGGGLITVPALIYAGLPPAMVLGTNKAQSACGTGMASWRYHKAGLFSLRPALPAVVAVFAGAMTGTLVVSHLKADWLRLIVPVLLMAISLYTLLSPRMKDSDEPPRVSPRGYLPAGAAVGFYDGFFGPGAGQFYTMTLVSLRGMGLTRATGLTKLFNLTSNIAAITIFASGGHILWATAACMAAGSMTGAVIGSHMASRLGARVIRPLLVTVSLTMTGKLIWGMFAS